MLLLLCSTLSAGEEKPANKEKTEKNQPPAKAPAFALKNYDGKEIKLADYKGKIVVLEWFNYECPFVRYHYEKELTMTKLAAKYRDKDVIWLAVNSTSHQKTDENKKFAEKNKIPYPILDDRAGRTGKAYKAQTTPHIFIISKDGKIAYSGAVDDSPLGKKKDNVVNYIDKALAELTEGKDVSISNTRPYGCSIKYAD